MADNTTNPANSTTEPECIIGDEHDIDETHCPLPDDLTDKIVDLVVLSIFIVVGVVGNALLIISIITTKRMQKPQYYFILSIATADFIICAYVLPCVFTGRITNRNKFERPHCIFNAFLCFACTGISNTCFCAIAVNRYCFVIRRQIYNRLFNGRSTLIIILVACFCWCLFSAVEGSTGNFTYLGDAYVCFNFDANHVFSATFLLATVGVAIPLCVSLSAYGAIFRQMYRVKTSLNNNLDTSTSLTADEKKAIIAILVAFLVFNICWIPYIVQVFMEKMNTHTSNKFHKYSVWMSFFNSTMNAIIYGVMNAEFRASYWRVLTCRSAERRR